MMLSSRVLPIALLDGERIRVANPAFAALFGHRKLPSGTSLRGLIADDDHDSLDHALQTVGVTPVSCEAWARRRKQADIRIELHLSAEHIGDRDTILAVGEDISDRYRYVTALDSLAFSDSLTGLPNRALFEDRLGQRFREAQRDGETFAVLMADLDGFKLLNDNHGHEAGDFALQVVSNRFEQCLRESDTVARIGGDEFAVLLPKLKDPKDAARAAERLLSAASAPIAWNDLSLTVGLTVGIAIYPDHAASAARLMAAADAALYAGKARGKGQCVWAEADSAGDPHVDHFALSTDAHTVGVAQIDHEHSELVDKLDAVIAALKNDASRASIDDKFSALVAYAQFHFDSEERLLTSHGVEGTEVHAELHKRLIDDVFRLSGGTGLGSLNVTVRYLQQWLFHHIDTIDRPAAQALAARGVR